MFLRLYWNASFSGNQVSQRRSKNIKKLSLLFTLSQECPELWAFWQACYCLNENRSGLQFCGLGGYRGVRGKNSFSIVVVGCIRPTTYNYRRKRNFWRIVLLITPMHIAENDHQFIQRDSSFFNKCSVTLSVQWSQKNLERLSHINLKTSF